MLLSEFLELCIHKKKKKNNNFHHLLTCAGAAGNNNKYYQALTSTDAAGKNRACKVDAMIFYIVEYNFFCLRHFFGSSAIFHLLFEAASFVEEKREFFKRHLKSYSNSYSEQTKAETLIK